MRRFDADHWFTPTSFGHTKEEIEKTIQANSMMDGDNPEWKEHATENEKHMTEDRFLTNKYGSWEGCNVLAVASGPSMRKHKEEIQRAYYDGHKIICVDRSHAYLKSIGVTPHLTVACDHRAIIGEFLRKIKIDDTLAIDVVCHPKVLDRMTFKTDNMFVFSLVNPFSQTLVGFYKKYNNRLFAAWAGYCVGFNSTSIAYWMGAKEIATIGHDLSWPSMDEVESMYKNSPDVKLLKVQSHDTGEIKITIPCFLQASGVFALLPKMHTDCKFTDCSNGLITTFEQKTLTEVLDKWQTNK